MGRTEYNETGNMEVRRRQQEILADQERANEKYEELETKYKALQAKHDELERLVIATVTALKDNYYNKAAVVEKINSTIISNRNR